jgi:hypothetical protein
MGQRAGEERNTEDLVLVAAEALIQRKRLGKASVDDDDFLEEFLNDAGVRCVCLCMCVVCVGVFLVFSVEEM